MSPALSPPLQLVCAKCSTSSAVFRFAFAVILAIGTRTSTNASAQLPAIELTALSRTAGTIGGEFELQLTAGSRLEEVDSLRFSDPAVTAELLTKSPLPRTATPRPEHGHFRVKIPPGVSPGRIEVRAVGRHGVSNPRIVRLTEHPCSVVEAASHDRENPTEFPQGHLLLARCTPAEIDYFAVPVEKGNALRIRLAAQTIDSRMIGQLVLLDHSGKIIRSSRGTDRIDPEVMVTAEQSGDYLLAVHDFLYRGGNEYPYQLVIEPIPEGVDFVSPDRSERRQPIEEVASAFDRPNGRLPGQIDPSAVGLYRAKGSSPETQWLTAVGDAEGESLIVHPPARIAGYFDANLGTAGEQRVVRFEAEKGQQWALEIESQRLGQPTDVRLIIERLEAGNSDTPQWNQVAVADDSQTIGDGAISLRTSDPVMLFPIPETGSYRAVVRDLDTGEALGARQYFAMEIRRPDPGFELLAYPPVAHHDLEQSKPTGVNLVRGGAHSIRVFAIRRDGWTGRIELTLEGLPEGLSCSPVSIPANQDRATLNVVAREDAGSWTGTVRLWGRAQVADADRAVEAVPATVQWAKNGGRPFVRSRLTTEVALAVSDQDICPVSVQWGDETMPEAAPGSTLKVPIRLVRHDGGKGACVVRPQDLPPGVSAGEVTIPADQSDGVIEIKIEAKAAPGIVTPWLQVETPVKWRPNPQRLERAKEYLARLQEQLAGAESDEDRAAIEAAIKIAEKRMEAAKPSANPQDITLYLPSNNTTFRVVSP